MAQSSTEPSKLLSYVSSRLPYMNRPVNTMDLLNTLNPKYKLFYDQGGRRAEALTRLSVSSPTQGDGSPMASISVDKNFYAFMYAEADYNKQKRMGDYRIMASFSEVADALDEICDECVVVDENGNIVQLLFNNADFDEKVKEELNRELKDLLTSFELKHRGWQYFRSLLVEGELFFENVVSNKNPDRGILGFVNIPTELIDPVYDNVQNLILKGFMLRKPRLQKTPRGSSNLASSQTPPDQKFQMVPMDKNQVTYINSNIWNYSKSFRVPFIENARRAYRQLALIEDSIVIYRLVRAPERLVFNVDTGTMPSQKAEAYLQRLMKNYWSRKTYDNDQGKSVLTYNPQSMLDSFWFAKREGSQGTTVTQLAGGTNLGELTDLMYFVKKLYKSLKVPVNRLNEESRYEDSATILREELKFARFIIRLQQHFAAGLKEMFVTHLKFKNLWEQYSLSESDIELEFNAPSSFHELREQQLREIKFNAFSSITQSGAVSNTYAMKKYLGWTDVDVGANREFLKKDAGLKWELAQIEAGGPDWRAKAEEMAQGGGEEGVAAPVTGTSGGGGAPPSFGPILGGGTETGEEAPEEAAPETPEAGATPAPATPAAPAPATPQGKA
jgi:hypothetical protein